MRFLYVSLLKREVPATIDFEYDQILQAYSSYYRHLDSALQQLFRLRLYKLLHVLSFSSREFRGVTREMRVVIGCALIEITFGLKGFLPRRLNKVFIFPRRYMYPGYGQPFLGHVDARNNSIYFSWEDVQHGYVVHDDAVNVALHEMAHVLEHENEFYYLFKNFFSAISWEKWAELAFNKMNIIRSQQNDFLKSYGGINMSEMFAVCVETFFEQPADFKNHLPDLYWAMVDLLRQNPLNRSNPLIL